MEAMQQMAAVALVLALLGTSLWWLRRRGFAGVTQGRRPGARRIESLERLALGPQHTLLLVRVDQSELLLALSPSGCWLVERCARGVPEAGQ
jgi:flagellar biogenesis protein FliO